MTAQQARLVALAPALAPVSLSLNSSAIYLGSATGAAAGALIVADGVAEHLGWVAAGFALSALLPLLADERTRWVEVDAFGEDGRGRGRRSALRKN